jgi:ergothioneine biosynthesis protein EgtB
MSDIISRFRETRAHTEALCDPLLVEDYGVQSMPDASPPKWHLAHTSWFFENFLLAPFIDRYKSFNSDFGFIFNSYYNSVGSHLERNRRGLLNRPAVREIYQYRAHVDECLKMILEHPTEDQLSLIELGLQHEQQHQELLLTDIKHVFWSNPLKPAYLRESVETRRNGFGTPLDGWFDFEKGVREIGYSQQLHGAFSFDNETPRHPVYIGDFKIQKRLITNREFYEFIQAGGYRNPLLWLSQGWDLAKQNHWEAPLYWMWPNEMTLSGIQPLDLDAPVAHVSFYEADAFARWRGARLPTEEEWEIFAEKYPKHSFGNPYLLWGERWQWTSSAYRPYPGFKPLPHSLGEYNEKFMSNQMVLRGGSCATPKGHIRSTYRNFFAPESRWQFTGIRLAL